MNSLLSTMDQQASPYHQASSTRPTQGDWVLMREMAPNRPDIAQQVSEHALHSLDDEDSFERFERVSQSSKDPEVVDSGGDETSDVVFSRKVRPVLEQETTNLDSNFDISQAEPCLAQPTFTGVEAGVLDKSDTQSPDLGSKYTVREVDPLDRLTASVGPNNEEEKWNPCLDCHTMLSVKDIDQGATVRCESCRREYTIYDLNRLFRDIGKTRESNVSKSNQNHDDKISVVSSYAASIASTFSVESLASSATDLSKASGYSAVAIATATKTLLSILYEDEDLLSLYQSSLEKTNIGPERLQRNLRRLFKRYADDLGREEKDRLEYLASRLVSLKAGWLARSIVEKLQINLASQSAAQFECHEDSSDDDDKQEVNVHPVDENAFEDLVDFRNFLVRSDAFITLRARLQDFVHVKMLDSLSFTKKRTLNSGPSRTWKNWTEDAKQTLDNLFYETDMILLTKTVSLLAVEAFYLITDNLMIAMGQLERPLQEDMVRLRWRSTCGDALYSDVTELRKGGAAELMGHMQRLCGVNVLATTYSRDESNQQYIFPRPIQWARNAVTKLINAFGQSSKATSCLPQHSTQCPTTACPITACSASYNSSQQKSLHLLACMHRNRFQKVLKQDRIEAVTTDRTLLCFLRQQYSRHRGRFLHKICLKSVTGMLFVKFRLPIGGSVDVRHHNPCCVNKPVAAAGCECIPPPPKVEPSPTAEYRCIPGPPATYPPIPPEYLSSLFTCPSDVHTDDTWILDQLPKRTCGELRGQVGKPAEGWGIYYQEGWDRDMITLMIFLIFLLASLLFGILWSKFHFDVQGAFGVSAYMVAACSILITLVANWSERAG